MSDNEIMNAVADRVRDSITDEDLERMHDEYLLSQEVDTIDGLRSEDRG